jgi:NTP pyrophosphatase (non-canonical NTP hydrolase)
MSPPARPGDSMTEDVRPIDRLLAIMAQLRDPETGCAWDLEQSPLYGGGGL